MHTKYIFYRQLFIIQCEGHQEEHTVDLLVRQFNFEERGKWSQGLLLIVKTDCPVPDHRKWLERITHFGEFEGIPKVCIFLSYTMMIMWQLT